MSDQNRDAAYLKFVANDFKHHNPYFEGSAEALHVAMKANAKQNPAKILEVKRVIVEGDFVVTHSHVRQNPNDRIVELWDLGQPIPEKLLNENGMF